MSNSRHARIFAAIGALALVPAALTACSAGGQSAEDACKVAGETVNDAMGDMSSVASDPEAAVALIDDAMAAMEEAGAKIENEEVKAAFDEFNGAFADFQTALGDGAGDPANIDVEALTAATTDLQESAQSLQEVCG